MYLSLSISLSLSVYIYIYIYIYILPLCTQDRAGDFHGSRREEAESGPPSGPGACPEGEGERERERGASKSHMQPRKLSPSP